MNLVFYLTSKITEFYLIFGNDLPHPQKYKSRFPEKGVICPQKVGRINK